MSNNDSNDPISKPVGQNLSAQEKALRDQFVAEYLVDYDGFAAAVRIGYSPTFAKNYSVRFLQEPYVLQKIKESEIVVDNSTEEGKQASEAAMKQRILTALVKEACYKGPGSSHGARVAALAKLVSVFGMEAPKISKTEITGNDGGTFVIPGIMSVEEWEKRAAEQQAQLVASSTTKES